MSQFTTNTSKSECPVAGFTGAWFDRDGPAHRSDYELWCYQYASTAYAFDGMKPRLILVPRSDDDVCRAIGYARALPGAVNIAVRTGGHQYCGASSTGGDNIQLDMSEAYRDLDQDFKVTEEAHGVTTVRVGVSFSLLEFNSMLGKKHLFVPTGQCSQVHLGGHVQTGGYGQLGRAFGLFADHVRSFEIITATGDGPPQKQTVERGSADPGQRDLYFAVLGGSPGNFGVLTHVTLEVYRDVDYPLSRGLRGAYIYNKEGLAAILERIANMSTMDRDFDLCVTVLTADDRFFPHLWWKAGYDEEMLHKLAVAEHRSLIASLGHNILGQRQFPYWPSMVVVYAQWANTGGRNQLPGPEVAAWFRTIEKACAKMFPVKTTDWTVPTPMSKLTEGWIFQDVREYEMPYEKRCYSTNWSADQLAASGWARWAADRIDVIQSQGSGKLGLDPRRNKTGCKLSVQIQNFGGAKSKFFENGIRNKDLTAYSWRDITVSSTMDCFFDVSANPNALETALRWHAQNEFEGLGPGKRFSDSMPSRKLLWASYGDRNMGNVHDQYYPRAVYDRLVAIKRRVDPRPLFTPNAFCVGAPPTQPQPAAAEAAAAATLPVPVLQPADAFRRTMALASVPTKTFEGLDLARLLRLDLASADGGHLLSSHLGIAHSARSFLDILVPGHGLPAHAHALSLASVDAYMCEWIKARYRPLIAVAQDNGGDKTVGPKPMRSLAEERRNG